MGTGGMEHMGNRPQWVQGVWGTGGMGRVWAIWVMGHMDNRVHGQWGTWAMGSMGDLHIFAHNIINTGWILKKFLLHIDIDVFYLNTGRFFHDGFI